jgi:outer membrane translocation and assembly module TamA
VSGNFVGRLLLTITIAIVGALPAAAQSTRVEAIAEEQKKKAGQLGVEGPGEAEMVIRRILLSPLLTGGDGIYPWFGSVFGGTGAGIGAGYLKRFEQGGHFNVQGGVSLNSSLLARMTVAAPELWRGMLHVEGTAQWVDALDVSFYGLGPDTDKSDRQHYDYSPTELSATATLRPRRHLFLTGGYLHINLETGRDLPMTPPEQMPGIGAELRYHVGRALVAFDTRQSPGYTTSGTYVAAAVERHHERAGQPYSFVMREIEVSQFVPLVREQFVIAVRGLVTTTSTDTGQEVPFMLAPYLGSGSTLRGFSNRRFTDRNRVLLSGEYRWRPSRYLDMALFVDTGQVAADRRQLEVGDFETAWGIGARFHGPLFTALRIEAARGREGTRLIFAGSQAF